MRSLGHRCRAPNVTSPVRACVFVSVCLSVCLSVRAFVRLRECVRVTEIRLLGQRGRARERERARARESERARERESERARERESEKERARERESARERARERVKEMGRRVDGGGERETCGREGSEDATTRCEVCIIVQKLFYRSKKTRGQACHICMCITRGACYLLPDT